MAKKPEKLPTIKEIRTHIGHIYSRQEELLRLIRTNTQALYNYISFKKDLEKFDESMAKKIKELDDKKAVDKFNAMKSKEKVSNLKKEAKNEPKKEKK